MKVKRPAPRFKEEPPARGASIEELMRRYHRASARERQRLLWRSAELRRIVKPIARPPVQEIIEAEIVEETPPRSHAIEFIEEPRHYGTALAAFAFWLACLLLGAILDGGLAP